VKADLEKMARMIELIKENPNISVDRLQRELGLSKSSIYRWLRAISVVLPIRLEKGKVIKI